MELLQLDGYFGGENSARGGPVDCDAGGLVGFQKFFVDRDGIFEPGGNGCSGAKR
jgi:hypothetical protein